MDLPLEFAEILDAAEGLSRAEQEKLVAILQRRHAEVDRQALEALVAQVRHEFAEGQYRPVSVRQLVFEGYHNQVQDNLDAVTQGLQPRTLMIRTQAFADYFLKFRYSGECPFVGFMLLEPLAQLAGEAVKPSLPTRRLQGKLSGCRVWSARPDLDILFDHVQHDRHDAILLLAICQPRLSLY